jgi:hypothetical protein
LSFGKMEWNKCNFENILLKTELLFWSFTCTK